jgi:hypothetical protein
MEVMRIIVEFAGGPLDGKTVEGEWGDEEEADRYYLLTHHGAVGQRFKIASEYAVETLAREKLKRESRHFFQRHVYEVTHRLEADDEVLVRAEYVPPERPRR